MVALPKREVEATMFDDGMFSHGPYSGVGTPGGEFPDVLPLEESKRMLAETDSSDLFLGVDSQNDPVVLPDGGSPHVLINAGTGGGKSTIVRSLVAQHVARGGAVIVLDYKQHSHKFLKGLEPSVQYASKLPDIGNALVQIGREVHKRNARVDRFDGPAEDAPVGVEVMVVFEEMNATMELLKDLDKRLPDGEYKALQGLQDAVFLGRAARFRVVATAQLASRRAMGGAEILVNFNYRILLQYDETSWRWLVGGRFQAAPAEQGRGMVIIGGVAHKTQFLRMTEPEAREYILSSKKACDTARDLCPRLVPLPRVWKNAARRAV